ncbi:trypsin-like peptidase domain-containing protein [uncultured Microbacterium sp.]|uniref:S1C family serine protease n=1 Tax=uncultured Microbacterium sp. TaxID=191216 RepID=UPI002636A890|nr:trypsin-like peptidase domain-containing protein [uncultured Microbacterium sp.]
MNEENTPIENTPAAEPVVPEAPVARTVPPLPETPAAVAAAGHGMPRAFASHAPAVQQPAVAIPAPVHAERPQITQPTTPLPQGYAAPLPSAAAASHAPKKSSGAGKVAALIVAAALVGGGAGLGSSYLGNTLWGNQGSSSASGPESITVNNPGSVNETTAIATSVLPSVVTIDAAGSSASGSGSGVILSEDGYVLTNTHVVTLGGAEANPRIQVTASDGSIYSASIVGTDPIYDLAVLKIEGADDLTPIEFADSSKLNVGSTAVAVGAPLGLSNSVTTGIVSALNRSIQIASSALPESADQDAPEGDQEQSSPFQFDLPGSQGQATSQSISIAVIQTDAAINPGNSGGALVDSEGKLIGINVAIATAGSSEESGSIGLGFAIPSNVAQRIAVEIIETGSASHGLLGASVRDAAYVEGADVAGAYIAEAPSGAAAEAGLRRGDIITKFNGMSISGATDLTAQVRAVAAGSEATVTYQRDGESAEVDVVLGELGL